MLESVMDKTMAKKLMDTLKEFINVFEITIHKLKSSGGSISDAEIITLLLSLMLETIDIIFSKHPEDVDLNYVKNALLQEELQQSNKTSNEERLVAFNSKKKFVSNRWKNKYMRNSGNKTEANVPFRFNCYNRGCKGHKKSECKFSLRNCNVSSTSDHQGYESDGGTTFVAANRNQNANSVSCPKSSTIRFVIDSGATNHMINKKYEEHLVNTMDVNLSIAVAKSGVQLQGHKSGTLKQA
ncbi:hypothetical protein PR048_006832 [Dryococelus australis]|uniref:CCHC-type domain-containing protein n=1 Tax=Dryococelus australis TaxID=614101 RepID=A0ABQ9IDD3_9NEOP|nr:hypothetical protein PR048_006832 [Dryococelus australis]